MIFSTLKARIMKHSIVVILFCCSFSIAQDTAKDEDDLSCTKLQFVTGTEIKCHPPGKSSTDCKEENFEPGTKVKYSCLGKRGEEFSGSLSCAYGIWQSVLHGANSSLCNLGGKILNIVYPDFIRVKGSFDKIQFQIPSLESGGHDSTMTEEEKIALNLHNVFRAKHGSPPLNIDPKFNEAAQKVVKKLANNFSMDVNANAKALMTLKKGFSKVNNMETNVFRQEPANLDKKDVILRAITSLYFPGKRAYDWEHIENNFPTSNALTFSRVVWKATTTMGIATANFKNFSYVVCVYSPGRNVTTTDVVADFQENVLPLNDPK